MMSEWEGVAVLGMTLVFLGFVIWRMSHFSYEGYDAGRADEREALLAALLVVLLNHELVYAGEGDPMYCECGFEGISSRKQWAAHFVQVLRKATT